MIGIVTAPRPGTGKGLLVDSVVIIGTGQRAGNMVEGESDAEWRKKITAELMDGRTVHVIDNVEIPFGNASLASLATTGEWVDRILGVSKLFRVSGDATGFWCATGNNITLTGDMPRRCFHVRLDSKQVDPYLRKDEEFTHADQIDWVTRERPAILGAILTNCRAWFARGRPTEGAPNIGSFREWAKTLWGVLSLDPTMMEGRRVGSAFLENGPELWRRGSNDEEEMEPFLIALHEWSKGNPRTCAEVEHDVSGEYPLQLELRDALPDDLRASLARGSFTKKLSTLLRRYTDTRFGEEMWRIEPAGKIKKRKALLLHVARG